MKSIIKTKCNRVPLAFKKQITELKGMGDINFLTEFVKDCHKNADIMQIDENTLQVSTKRISYLYSCFPNYIRQINRNTDSRIFFKIS